MNIYIAKAIEEISKNIKNFDVLECGTKRQHEHPTTIQSYISGYNKYIKTDVESGLDVDEVFDLHSIPHQDNSFDLIVCMSVLEHVMQPWIVCNELFRVLKPNGYCLVITHQTFPIHGYPSDYFRFSDKALESLFPFASQKESFYEFPCTIVPNPATNVWNHLAPAYQNVGILVKK
jgi:SAM-dependent methyltransferase